MKINSSFNDEVTPVTMTPGMSVLQMTLPIVGVSFSRKEKTEAQSRPSEATMAAEGCVLTAGWGRCSGSSRSLTSPGHGAGRREEPGGEGTVAQSGHRDAAAASPLGWASLGMQGLWQCRLSPQPGAVNVQSKTGGWSKQALICTGTSWLPYLRVNKLPWYVCADWEA